MELTQAQYERIAPHLPVQRGNVSLSNQQVLNAILYVAEHGCKWRGLPARFGNWHTLYTRMNRWSKNGVLDRVFEHLQREQIVRVKLEGASWFPHAARILLAFHYVVRLIVGQYTNIHFRAKLTQSDL